MTDLKIAICSHDAAKYAVEHWHYSRCLPVGKLVRLGIWEDGKFIGVVVFSRGASMTLSSPYGLTQTECCELTRVALAGHSAPVTQIVAAAIKRLSTSSPGLRLIVSFADPAQGHHGGIYQAGSWIYAGQSTSETRYRDQTGALLHRRVIAPTQWGRPNPRAGKTAGLVEVKVPGKHRYLMPLDRAMRRKIAPLARTYPSRVRSVDGDTSGPRSEDAGSTPAGRST